LKKSIAKKVKQRYEKFIQPFDLIAKEVKIIYRKLTGGENGGDGGDAELSFKDFNDPFGEGINFEVRPLNKSWK
jgi:chromosome segregation ATPase